MTAVEGKAITIRPYIAAAGAVAVFAATAVAAGAPSRQAEAKEIYSAFTLLARTSPSARRCGPYTVVRGKYTGRSTSADARLVGPVTFDGRLATNGAGAGLATGSLIIRDGRGAVRMRGALRGVVSKSVNVSGIVSGKLSRPNALLLANVSMFFYPGFRQATVRIGSYDSRNSAVAYSRVGKCG